MSLLNVWLMSLTISFCRAIVAGGPRVARIAKVVSAQEPAVLSSRKATLGLSLIVIAGTSVEPGKLHTSLRICNQSSCIDSSA